MRNSDLIGRRGELEQLTTEQLDRMLHAELNKEDADPGEVKLILAVLKAREEDMPVEPNDAARLAWKKYQSQAQEDSAKPAKRGGWLMRAAAIAVVLCALLVGLSSQAEADEFWGRIARWTDSVIEFFSPGSTGGGDEEYVFRTEHPGLQQVYDTIAELGVTQPVVPMWLPEGYAIISCQEMKSTSKTTVMSGFQNGEKVISFNVAVYTESVSNQYQKDDTAVKILDLGDISHYIVKNNDAWVVVWAKENIECSLLIDCQDDELYKILRSIYDKEEST